MTRYIILQAQSAKGVYVERERREAQSSDAAIRAYLNSGGDQAEGGTFVAVPERSFQPVTFQIERTTSLRLVEGGNAAPPATEPAADKGEDHDAS